MYEAQYDPRSQVSTVGLAGASIAQPAQPLQSSTDRVLGLANEALSLAEAIEARLVGSAPSLVGGLSNATNSAPEVGNVRRTIDRTADRLDHVLNALSRINSAI
jgi:hypothetical protein